MSTERPRSVMALWPVVASWAMALTAGFAADQLAAPDVDPGFARWFLDVTTFGVSIALGNALQRRLLARIDPDGSLRHRATTFGADADHLDM